MARRACPGVILTYGYDADGNRTSLDDNYNGLTSYVYDVRDQLATITQSGTGVAAKRVELRLRRRGPGHQPDPLLGPGRGDQGRHDDLRV